MRPPTTLRKSWILQVGPLVKHEIEIEKKYKVSAIVTLTVDGTTLLEAKAEDFDCPDIWDASFVLFGERYIDWDLFETDRWGAKLDTQGIMTQPLKYKHSVNVTIPNLADLNKAELSIDGVPYSQLKIHSQHEEAPMMTLEPDALYMQYKMATPYKIRLDPQDTTFGQAQVYTSAAEATLRPVSVHLSQAATQLQPHIATAGEMLQPHLDAAGQQMGEALGSLQQRMGEMFRPAGGYSTAAEDGGQGSGPAVAAVAPNVAAATADDPDHRDNRKYSV